MILKTLDEFRLMFVFLPDDWRFHKHKAFCEPRLDGDDDNRSMKAGSIAVAQSVGRNRTLQTDRQTAWRWLLHVWMNRKWSAEWAMCARPLLPHLMWERAPTNHRTPPRCCTSGDACAKCDFFAEVRLCEMRSGTLTVHILARLRQKHQRHLCTSTVFHTGTTVRGHWLAEEQIQSQEMLWSWKEGEGGASTTTSLNSN